MSVKTTKVEGDVFYCNVHAEREREGERERGGGREKENVT